jgi:hypothetical protein
LNGRAGDGGSGGQTGRVGLGERCEVGRAGGRMGVRTRGGAPGSIARLVSNISAIYIYIYASTLLYLHISTSEVGAADLVLGGSPLRIPSVLIKENDDEKRHACRRLFMRASLLCFRVSITTSISIFTKSTEPCVYFTRFIDVDTWRLQQAKKFFAISLATWCRTDKCWSISIQ